MHNRASLALSLAVMAMAAYAIIAASAWPLKAALFPLVIAIPLFCLAAAEAAWVLFGAAAPGEPAPEDAAARRRVWRVIAWMAGFFAAIVLAGFPLAVPLFMLLYLKLEARESWTMSLGVTLGVSALFYGLFDALLHLPFARGWLFAWPGF